MTRKIITYRIRCVANDKSYIGRTSCLESRINHHVSMLRSNKHTNELMQSDFNKYGEESFKVSVLDISSEKVHINQAPKGRVSPEKLYMALYKTYDKNYGYNYKDPAYHPRRNHTKKEKKTERNHHGSGSRQNPVN